jgi:hypothetical protein
VYSGLHHLQRDGWFFELVDLVVVVDVGGVDGMGSVDLQKENMPLDSLPKR